MTEQEIQKKILNWLDKRGYWAVKTIQSNKRGVPDILACSPLGEFIAIEVKTPKGVVSELQQYQLAKINDTGGIAFVARSLEDVIEELGSEEYEKLSQSVDTKSSDVYSHIFYLKTRYGNETK